MVPPERNSHGDPLAGLLWERQFEEVLLGPGWEKYRIGECLFVHRKQGFVLSVYVDDIKIAGRKHKYGSHVDQIDETCPSWRTHITCECKPNEIIVEEYTKVFESRNSAGAPEKLRRVGETSRKNSRLVL